MMRVVVVSSYRVGTGQEQRKEEGRRTRERKGRRGRKREGRKGKNQKNGMGNYGKIDDQFFERLMTVEDLADAFGFAPQTVRNWVALRKIPFIRLGGKTRFRHESIKAWLEQQEFRTCQ